MTLRIVDEYRLLHILCEVTEYVNWKCELCKRADGRKNKGLSIDEMTEYARTKAGLRHLSKKTLLRWLDEPSKYADKIRCMRAVCACFEYLSITPAEILKESHPIGYEKFTREEAILRLKSKIDTLSHDDISRVEKYVDECLEWQRKEELMAAGKMVEF